MKKILTWALAAIATLSLVSCKDFLETNPTSSVSDNQVFTSIQGANAALNGCYNLLHFNDEGYGRGDVSGYISQICTFDTTGEDIIVNGGWYGYDYNYWGHQRGDIFKTYTLWNYYYVLINNLNSVIKYTPEIEGAAEADVNAVVGQALVMRGWSYFMLAQLFQHTYQLSSPKDMPGVPIYTEPTTDETEGKPRGTINETYKQVLDDLTAAETMLSGYSRLAKNHVDQSVCQGILARVYLVMQNWTKAAEYAAKARSGYSLTSNADYTSGFNDINTGSWMWGLMQDKENKLYGNGDYGPFALWANWITRNGGDLWSFNCWFLPDAFVALFEDSDIRKGQMFFRSDMGNGLWCSSKFYDNLDLTGSFVYMRAEEMLLIEAEAKAHSGDQTGALALLNQLQSMRGATPTTKTGDALIEDILLERRKELYGEGFGWLDIVRNCKPLLREGNHVDYSGHTPIPAKSWAFVYQIPQSEILNNPNINGEIWPAGDQNPFAQYYDNKILE